MGRSALIAWACCWLLLAASAAAGEPAWGHLRGTFIYDGPAPEPRYLSTANKDFEVCGARVLDESLLVDPKTLGIKNVVVYLRAKDVAVHESYAVSASSEVRITSLGCINQPHIGLVRVGQTLNVDSDDPIAHNQTLESNVGIGSLIPHAQSTKHRFNRALSSPTRITCSVHPWMISYVLIRVNPYMAVTALDGSFEIKHLPAGEWEFQVWHETSGYLKTAAWPNGRFNVAIRAGETSDLGSVLVDPKSLESTTRQ